MAKRTSGAQIIDKTQDGDRINYKEIMVSLKPEAASGKTIKKLRLIGYPIEYREATPYKRDADKNRVPCAFPDAAVNKSFTRICDDDLDKDIWNQMGYVTTKRFAINVIDREDGKVKILAKGISIFKQFAEAEQSNAEENIQQIEDGDELLWTQSGGAYAADVKITAQTNPKALGGVDYTVFFVNKANYITEEEIEKLRAVGCPTPAEMEALKAAYPDDPEWFFYGHKLENIFKPSVLRTPAAESGATTPTEEMSIPVDDDDEDDTEAVEEVEEVAPSTEAPKAPKAPKGKAKDEEELSEVEW